MTTALQTPQSEGADAFRDGRPTASCHYPDGSNRKVAWVKGWTQQQIDQRSVAGGDDAIR